MEKSKKAKFNIQCPRCQGSGRFDRGACFQCKGRRYILTSRKPSGEPHNLVVTFDAGHQNFVKMYFFSREYAIKAVEYQLITRGWKGTIAEVGQDAA